MCEHFHYCLGPTDLCHSIGFSGRQTAREMRPMNQCGQFGIQMPAKKALPTIHNFTGKHTENKS